MIASAIYEGTVWHRRARPAHSFSQRLFMMYLDMAELPQVFAQHPLWSADTPNVAWFRRRDYLAPHHLSITAAVRQLVWQRAKIRPEGPIRLLTHARYFGWCFNPVSFYYCFDSTGDHVEAIVAEITNTPWNERHCYVLPTAANHGTGGLLHFKLAKQFHVSPFQPMQQSYEWWLSPPGSELTVRMHSHAAGQREFAAGQREFAAGLTLRRRQITRAALTRVLCHYPLMTLQVAGNIYAQAARLLWKRAPVHDHPSTHADRRQRRAYHSHVAADPVLYPRPARGNEAGRPGR